MPLLRKLFLITAVIAIAIILFSASIFLKGSVRTIKHGFFPVQNAELDYKTQCYSLDNYTILFAVPKDTEVFVSPDKGKELKFSTYLFNKNVDFRGYIQLWQIEDLERFLNYSKSLSPFDFRSYEMTPIQTKEYHGFKIQWTASFAQKSISGEEYWLKIDKAKEAIRLSIMTDTPGLPETLQTIEQNILDSLHIDIKSLI